MVDPLFVNKCADTALGTRTARSARSVSCGRAGQVGQRRSGPAGKRQRAGFRPLGCGGRRRVAASPLPLLPKPATLLPQHGSHSPKRPWPRVAAPRMLQVRNFLPITLKTDIQQPWLTTLNPAVGTGCREEQKVCVKGFHSRRQCDVHFGPVASCLFNSTFLQADLDHSPAAIEETFFVPISRLNKVERLANTLGQPWWPKVKIRLVQF